MSATNINNEEVDVPTSKFDLDNLDESIDTTLWHTKSFFELSMNGTEEPSPNATRTRTWSGYIIC